jgi:hypothetical protein
MKTSVSLLALAALATSLSAPADDNSELARKAADPTASLMSFNFRYNIVPSYYGVDDTGQALQFQPVIPFSAWGTSNILRATITYDTSGPAGSGLADVSIFDLVVFEKSWGRWGIGPVMQLLPDRGEGKDNFAIGPAVGFVISQGKWTYGLFNQNLFGGDIQISSLQPVLAYQLGQGWAISTGDAQWTVDWDSSELVNLPLGLQLSKVSSIGGQAVKWSLNPEYNARSLDGTPQWTIRAGFSLLVPGG